MRRWKREKKKNLPRKLHLCGQYMITISLLMKSSILLNFLLQIQAARHENRPSDLVSVRKLHSPNFVSYTKGLLLLYITDHRSPHQGVKPLQLRVALPSDLDCNVNNKGIVLCVLHWKTGTFWSSVQARLHNSSFASELTLSHGSTLNEPPEINLEFAFQTCSQRKEAFFEKQLSLT